jgi:hypothetical protein
MCIPVYILVGRLGSGSGVCEYIACPMGFRLVSLERLWFPLARLWAPFGVHLGPLGVHLVPFGLDLAPFGGPCGCLWGARGARGALGGLLGLSRSIF